MDQKQRPRTPPLKADADPQRAAQYADLLAVAKNLKEMNAIHAEYADLRLHQNLRQELGALIRAPKGSDEAKARDKLGITLILFGIFGVPLILFVALVIGGLVSL